MARKRKYRRPKRSHRRIVVSMSGGRSSARLSKIAQCVFGHENVDHVFMDTGAEAKGTYDFIRKCNEYFDLKLVCLRADFKMPLGTPNNYLLLDIKDIKPDLVPYEKMMEKYGVPYIGGMFCTDRMKLQPHHKFCRDMYGDDNYETWLGIRIDEPKRLWGFDITQPLKSCYTQISECGYDDAEISEMYVDIRTGKSTYENYELSDLALQLMKARIEKLEKEKIHYLAEIDPDFDKEMSFKWWESQPFDLEIDEWSGNCLYCPKKTELKLTASSRDNSDEYHKFLKALHSPTVRVDDTTGTRETMYRGKRSLEQVVGMFDGSTGDEIKARIVGAKMLDTGSCSESCEVFN
ncbi:hypothetical protein K1B37_001013 [Vibrio parahaemolyticus]|nr:hypothetical protein [Vibrio parahaemolyticus]